MVGGVCEVVAAVFWTVVIVVEGVCGGVCSTVCGVVVVVVCDKVVEVVCDVVDAVRVDEVVVVDGSCGHR